MKLLQKGIITLAVSLLYSYSFSQDIHSGFLTVQGSTEENSALKIHADNLTIDNSRDIAADFALYADIVSFQFDAGTHKIFVKFHAPMSANMVLGILERRAIHAYYLSSGSPVYYSKTGQEAFLR